MSFLILSSYLGRGVGELKTLTCFEDAKKLAKRTLSALLNEFGEVLVKENRCDSTVSQNPRILYVDSTGRDGYGIGDAIFTLPMLQSLGKVAAVDVLTTRTRQVIFTNQGDIQSVFTAWDQPGKEYDYILLLHRSVRKFQFIVQKYGWQGLTQKTLLSTYTPRFIQNIHTNQIEMAHAGVQDVVPDMPGLQNYTPHIHLSEEVKVFGREFVTRNGGKKNIALAVGNKDPRRDYKNLHQTIRLLAQTYPTYTFFCLGDESGLRQEVHLKDIPNIVCCSQQFTLEQSFGIMAATDGAIGLDSGLANAAIALNVPAYVIYNIVYPEERIPRDAAHVQTVDIGCANKCYYSSTPHICHKTGSSTPDCLETYNPAVLYNAIAGWMDSILTHQ